MAGNLIQAIARVTQPTDAEIQNYYAEHTQDFEQVRARHILISDVGALASRSNRSAAEAKTKAESIVDELKRGADFARLAAENSDASETKTGGELGYISHHQLEPEVDATLWSLAPGQTSAAFEGRFGYEIVQVEERRTPPLDSVRRLIMGKFIRLAWRRGKKKSLRQPISPWSPPMATLRCPATPSAGLHVERPAAHSLVPPISSVLARNFDKAR